MLLSDAIERYLRWRTSQGFARNTVRNDKSGLKLMHDTLGDMALPSIQYVDMERVLDTLAARRSPSSVNAALSTYSAFFKWARTMQIIGPDHDPMLGFRYRKVPKKNRKRFSLGEFAAVLDAATEPRIRMMVALGLFLFLRASEIVSLRLRDLDLDEGTIAVTVHKTGDHDLMPIPLELDAELRRWLPIYQAEVGRLHPDHFIIPSKIQSGFASHRLNPNSPISRPQEHVKRVYEAYGMADTKGEAMHVLRRSGARALFDELAGSGIDGALEIVQTQLHHASVTMTERYLGITHSRAKRDQLLRGESMFPSLTADNVVPLKSVV